MFKPIAIKFFLVRLIAIAVMIAGANIIAPIQAMAEGKLEMDFQPAVGRIRIAADREGSLVRGAMTHGRVSPAINLRQFGRDSWRGMISQEVESTLAQTREPGKFDVTVSAVTGQRMQSYAYFVQPNGDVKVLGSDQFGKARSAGMTEGGRTIYYEDARYMYEFHKVSTGTYSGSVIDGKGNAGKATLKTSGDLDPKILAREPTLFVLLYVFPFSH